MQKTIIAVQGAGDRGKSESICLVFDELRPEGQLIEPGCRTRKEVKGAIIEIDGVKVGFLSLGDKPWQIEEYLKPLIEAGCLVIVCAMHTRGETVRTVMRLASLAKPSFKVVTIDKPFDADPASGNRQKVDEIKRAVRKAIAEARQAELVGA